MMKEDKSLYEDILAENRSLHAVEAPVYERLHPEEFNWFEQKRIINDLVFISAGLPDNAHILDLGCGTGNLSAKILRLSAGARLYAVDISQDMLGIFEGRLTPEQKRRVNIVCAGADEFLDTCREKFDLIAMSSVLHHFPGYLQTLERVIGKLADGGWLYITHEPTRQSLACDPFLRKILWQADYAAYLLCMLGRMVRVTGQRDYHMSDYNLYHGFEEEKVISVCRNAGLRQVRLDLYASTMRMGVSCWIDTHLLRSKRQFSLIARKIEP
jgi:ubiquinone/menaquinone biosynthesis C-methylase UbiE